MGKCSKIPSDTSGSNFLPCPLSDHRPDDHHYHDDHDDDDIFTFWWWSWWWLYFPFSFFGSRLHCEAKAKFYLLHSIRTMLEYRLRLFSLYIFYLYQLPQLRVRANIIKWVNKSFSILQTLLIISSIRYISFISMSNNKLFVKIYYNYCQGAEFLKFYTMYHCIVGSYC